MPYTAEVVRRAERRLRSFGSQARNRILNAIELLAADPRRPGVEQLTGYQSVYRFRVGGYRIIFNIDDSRQTIVIIEIATRGQVYQRLRRRK